MCTFWLGLLTYISTIGIRRNTLGIMNLQPMIQSHTTTPTMLVVLCQYDFILAYYAEIADRYNIDLLAV